MCDVGPRVDTLYRFAHTRISVPRFVHSSPPPTRPGRKKRSSSPSFLVSMPAPTAPPSFCTPLCHSRACPPHTYGNEFCPPLNDTNSRYWKSGRRLHRPCRSSGVPRRRLRRRLRLRRNTRRSGVPQPRNILPARPHPTMRLRPHRHRLRRRRRPQHRPRRTRTAAAAVPTATAAAVVLTVTAATRTPTAAAGVVEVLVLFLVSANECNASSVVVLLTLNYNLCCPSLSGISFRLSIVGMRRQWSYDHGMRLYEYTPPPHISVSLTYFFFCAAHTPPFFPLSSPFAAVRSRSPPRLGREGRKRRTDVFRGPQVSILV